MNVVSLKEYAKNNKISYEAVRKQVVRYAEELESHIIKDGRQQFLDEEAVAFLDAKRQKNPVAIIQMDKDERIDALDKENKILLRKLVSVQDDLMKEKQKTAQLLEEKKEQIARLQADNAAAEKKVQEEAVAAQKARRELETEKNARKEDQEVWKNYRSALVAYNALNGFQRMFKKAPVPPEIED